MHAVLCKHGGAARPEAHDTLAGLAALLYKKLDQSCAIPSLTLYAAVPAESLRLPACSSAESIQFHAGRRDEG